MTPPAQRAPSLAALVLVTGVSPFATDTYVAALPQVRRALDTTASAAQLTITAFIVGMAAGQLLLGPVSDAVGRRRMMLGGTVAFLVLSLACAVAPSAGVLIACRFVQGVAGGCGTALGRAVVSDRYDGADAAARYGLLMGITLFGPVVAPAIGGLLLTVGDWRDVFLFLAGLGALMVAGVVLGVPETLPPERRHANGVREVTGRMRSLLRQRDFRAPVAVQCLATAGFFTYIGGSSFVLQGQLRMGPGEYALCFASNAFGMAVVSGAFGATVRRLGAARLRNAGLTLSTSAAVLLAAWAVVSRPGPPGVAVTWVLLALVVAGMGWVLPASTALAQQAGRRFGGAASALQGGLAFTVGALATPLTGLTGHQTVAGLGGLMVLFFGASVAVLVLTRSPGAAAPDAADARAAGTAGGTIA